ncbi:MAG: enoyl-CoA hydratase/isomerase family protein [Rhodothermales bacterium]
MPIQLTTDDHIARMLLDRPEKLNALTLEMLSSIENHLDTLEKDPSVRVLLITGAGQKSFCVGADINAWAELDAVGMWRNWIREGHRIFNRIATMNIPTIAVLNGYTFGGGLELALSTDIRIASHTVRFALPEVKLGIVPGWGGTNRLPAVIGTARAKQMVFTGMQIDTATALQWGLINEACEPSMLNTKADKIASMICENAPLAVQMTKQLIDGGVSAGNGYYLEALASGYARFTDDAKEGITAFKEKRLALFTGK